MASRPWRAVSMVYPSRLRISTIMSRIIGSSSTTKILRVLLYWFILLILFLLLILFIRARFHGSIHIRQIKTEGRTFTGNAMLKPQPTSHGFDVAATDIEPQSSPAYRRGQGTRCAHKLFKDFLLIFGRNTLAFVIDLH